jgi:hypothetical protein
MPLAGWGSVGWGMLATVSLLIMLARTCRWVRRPFAAVVPGAAVIVAPEPMANPDSLPTAFLLTYAVGAAVALGRYLRVRDARRARLLQARPPRRAA